MIFSLRIAVTLALAAAVTVATGCGEAAKTGSSAALAPLDTAVYASIDADAGSDQWTSLLAVLDRIPGAREAGRQALVAALADQGLDYAKDVDPALGDEVVVVVLPGGRVVGLTKPDDESKLKTLLERSGETPATGEVDGWTAVARTEADLDAYRQSLARGALEGESTYTDAVAGLPESALVRIYIRGDGLSSVIPSLGSGIRGLPSLSSSGIGQVGLALSAEDDGIRLSGVTRSTTDVGVSYEPTLLSRVPADARVALSFRGSDAVLDRVRDGLGGSGAAKQFEDLLGVPLERFVTLFSGEGVVYLRGGGKLPEVTIAVRSADPSDGLETLRVIAAALAKRLDGTVETRTVAGTDVTRLNLGDTTVEMGLVGAAIVATSSARGIASFAATAGGTSLATDPGFQAAAARVGYDGRTSGLVFVDVDGLIPIVSAASGGLPDGQARDVIESIDDVIVQTQVDGRSVRFAGFVRVR